MSNVQTLLRKRSITPMQTGKMILEDFIQTRKAFMQDPSIRSGSLGATEKELLISRALLSHNKRDTIIFLLLRDFLHELAFRQQLAVQSYELAFCKLSHMVELSTVAESMNLDRIGKKGKVSSSFFEEHRSESILNGRNAVESLKLSMVRSVAFLKATNTALGCLAKVTGLESIEGEITPLSGMYYDLGELQSMVDDLLGSIVRDGKEPVPVIFSGGIPTSPADWMLAIELSQEGERMEVDDLKKELRGILTVNVDLDQTAIEIFQKTFSLQKILSDGVGVLEKLTKDMLKEDKNLV